MGIKSKLDKIEKLLNAGVEKITGMIIVWDEDYIEKGYFKNKEENQLFIDWYIDKLQQRDNNKNIGKSVIEIASAIAERHQLLGDEQRYFINSKVIEDNLDEFKKYLLE